MADEQVELVVLRQRVRRREGAGLGGGCRARAQCSGSPHRRADGRRPAAAPQAGGDLVEPPATVHRDRRAPRRCRRARHSSRRAACSRSRSRGRPARVHRGAGPHGALHPRRGDRRALPSRRHVQKGAFWIVERPVERSSRSRTWTTRCIKFGGLFNPGRAWVHYYRRRSKLSTQMSDPRELFLHELGDVLYAEQTLVKALPKLKEEASDAGAREGIRGTPRGDAAARREPQARVRGTRRDGESREVPRDRGHQEGARRVRGQRVAVS